MREKIEEACVVLAAFWLVGLMGWLLWEVAHGRVIRYVGS